MKCNKNKLLISRYLDGNLSFNEESRLINHLKSCPECKKYFEQLKAVNQFMPDLCEKAPSELKNNVLNRIAQLEPSEKIKTRRYSFPYFTAASAACILIFALIGGHILDLPLMGSDKTKSAEDMNMTARSNEFSDAQPDRALSLDVSKSGGVGATESNDMGFGIQAIDRGEGQPIAPPIIAPQIEVAVDINAEKFEQQQVDEGHSPWRLDVIQTTITFVSLKINPEGVTGEFPISEKDITITEQTNEVAIVDIGGEVTPIRRVYLKRLVRQDNTGIWSVVGYDPAE